MKVMTVVEQQKEISVSPVQVSKVSTVDFDNLPFGRLFGDHMLMADYSNGSWHNVRIIPYDNLSIAPCITALHYGQSIFEGLKAFKGPDGSPLLFRPRENFLRMNNSARRMCMPEIPESIFMDGLLKLIKLDQQWIPSKPGSALYIRPLMFATDEYIGIKASDNYTFLIMTTPVGSYYTEPVRLLASKEYVRAVKGGTGEAKCAGNYAASLLGAQIAKEKGYNNVLWLDAIEKKYVEECGTMNIFFIVDGVAVTPKLTGAILRGITRDSTIALLKEKGIPVEERQISIDELVRYASQGKLQEAFGTGTAATIAPIERIGYEGEGMVLPEKQPIAKWLGDQLSGIRNGLIEDRHGWVYRV